MALRPSAFCDTLHGSAPAVVILINLCSEFFMQWHSLELTYNAEHGIHLQFQSQQMLSIPDDCPQLKSYLQQLNGVSALQMEQGADLVEIRFRFQQHNCMMQFEYYSQTGWVHTDSDEADVLLSAFAELLAAGS